jgi:protein-disulfide isomerase
VNKLFKSLLVSLVVTTLSHTALAADASSLKPPPGAKVAVVVFEDLECPSCAVAYPVVWDAANAHHVPVVLHDFPLSKHPWAFDAAVYARFFDTKSQQLGNDFRGFIYKNQINITAQNLRQFVQKFADDNKIPLPFTVEIQVDYALGQQVGLQHTPTIFVIGAGGPSTPFVEVTDLAQLGQIIEDMQRKAGAATAPVQQRARKVRR